MSIEIVEVEVAFAGIEAIEVEIVSESTPGLGSAIISTTAPSNPINGQQWIDPNGWIESIWSASESAWIIPSTNSISIFALYYGDEILAYGSEILTYQAA